MITLSLNLGREFSRENRMSHNYKSGMLFMDFLLIFQLHLSYLKKKLRYSYSSILEKEILDF